MRFDVNGQTIETDEQGVLLDPADWSEEFARALAEHDGFELFVDHWELIWYFRDYFEETQTVPTMRKMILELGKREGARFRDRKAYEKPLSGLFPNDPKHLALWIKNARKMKPGIIMPTLGKGEIDPHLKTPVTAGGLDDQQIADIVAYLTALK